MANPYSLLALADYGFPLQKNIVHDECGYNVYGVCCCDEMKCAGEDCPYQTITQCPVHNEKVDD